MRKLSLLSFFIFVSFLSFLKVSAQDTLVLMNGKRINGNVLEIQEKAIKYRIGSNPKSPIHSIKPYRVFAINKNDGTEKVIFAPDTLDQSDYTIPQLRTFIKGERAAQTGYNNTLNKALAFVAGAGASYFSIYGLVVPALYSSIVGASSPDINKQKNVDPALANVPEYQDGYLTITRQKKIRNSFVAGMIGFAVGFTTQAIIGNNTKK